jgi:hypothetical protein
MYFFQSKGEWQVMGWWAVVEVIIDCGGDLEGGILQREALESDTILII